MIAAAVLICASSQITFADESGTVTGVVGGAAAEAVVGGPVGAVAGGVGVAAIETRKPIPAKPGQPERHDYEYERNGVANLFMIFAPLEGWRRVEVTDHHTAADYANVLKELSDVDFPTAEKIVLVQDNLNTHTPASLYAAFPAPEARRLATRFEWHYTPKHGSWLDMAESELAVLTTQCLSRRIPDKETLEKEVAAWESHRNKHHAKADWQFTTENARVKLKRLYPQFQ